MLVLNLSNCLSIERVWIPQKTPKNHTADPAPLNTVNSIRGGGMLKILQQIKVS